MVGLQGQISRLEITSTIIDYEGEQRAADHRRRDRADADGAGAAPLPAHAAAAAGASALHLFALDSLAEAIIATDNEGRISYLERGGRASHRHRGAAGHRQAARGDRGSRRRDRPAPAQRPGEAGAHDRRAGESQPPRAAAVEDERQRALDRAVRLAHSQRRRRSSPARSSCCTTSPSCAALRGRCRTRRRTMRSPGLVNRREFERRLEEAVESGASRRWRSTCCATSTSIASRS